MYRVYIFKRTNAPDMRSKKFVIMYTYFFFVPDGEFEANTKCSACLRKLVFSISDVDSSHGSAALCGPKISHLLSSYGVELPVR